MDKFYFYADSDSNHYFLTKSGEIAEVVYDADCGSPREWDNLETFVTFMRNYNSPDECPFGKTWGDVLEYFEVDSVQELGAAMDKAGYIVAPVSVYDHSGLVYSIGSINDKLTSLSGMADRWDSSAAGFMYVSKEKIVEEYGELNDEVLDTVQRVFKGDCETYDAWQRGSCYGFNLYEKTGEFIDSCWGFIGNEISECGITDYVGEIAEDLGSCGSIEECFEKNQEKLGITLAPIPSLSERISLAVKQSAENNVVDKDNVAFEKE